MIFPALVAKLLSAGAVAQACTGAGVALVAFTGAGAAGVLPDPVQDTVSSVVETVTPFDLPSGDGTDGEQPDAEQPVAEEPDADQPVVEDPAAEQPVADQPEAEQPVVEAPAFDADAWAVEGPQDGQSFGQWVSLGAHHKAELGEDVRFGEIVSTWARMKHLDADDLQDEGVDLDELTDDADEPTTEVEPETGDDDAKAATTGGGKHGNGKSSTSGSGKAGGSSNAKAGGNGNGNAGSGHKGGNGKN